MKPGLRKGLLLGMLTLVLHCSAEDLKLYRVGVDDGLSQATVQCFLLDHYGHLWIGTQDGLNRYDGHRFRVFRPDPGASGTLPFTQINTLAEDSFGKIWVGMANGQVAVFDPLSERFTVREVGRVQVVNRLQFWDDRILCIGTRQGLFLVDIQGKAPPQGDPLPGTGDLAIMSMTRDETGQLWLATSQGLWCLRRDSLTGRVDVELRSLCRDGGHEPVLSAVYADGSGSLFAGGVHGLWRTGIRKPSPVEHLLDHDALGASVRTLGAERTGTLWVGTGKGICTWSALEGVQVYRGERDRSGSPFLDFEVTDIIRDQADNLWLGSNGGGMARWNPGSRVFAHLDARGGEPALSNPLVFSVLEDRLGRLWVGTLGGGLTRFADWRGGQPVRYGAERGFWGNRVSALFEDKSGTVWAGSERGLFRLDSGKAGFFHVLPPGETKARMMVTHIGEGDDGRLWVSTLNDGIFAFHPDRESAWLHWDEHKVLRSSKVFCTFQDSRGRIWVAYQEAGLDVLRGDGSRDTPLGSNGQVDGLTSPTILSFHEDDRGDIWIGTFGGGLLRAARGGWPLESIRVAQGLPNDVIYGVLADGRGLLWLSTNSGLARLDPQSRRVSRYSRQDGLLCNEFNLGAFHVGTHSRRLFFGGVEGLISFDPGQIPDHKPILPVVIRGAEILPMKARQARILRYPAREGAGPLVLNPEDRVLNMDVLSMNLADPGRGQCRFMLEPMDADWQVLREGARRVTYMNLAPGWYRFRAQGSDSDGTFGGEETTLDIRVIPPFWATLWFRVGLAGLLLGVGTMAYRLRLREIGRRTRMQLELEAAREAQGAIMPTRGIQGPGWEAVGLCLPAFEVGGDFYDYLRFGVDDRSMGIMVGDVSGKAMKAAMTALLANGMVHAGARWESSLHVLMDHLNALLHEKTDRRVFTAMALARYQPLEQLLTFVSAGLPEPLLGRKGQVRSLSGLGPRYPLGLLPEGGYQTTTLPLQAGDWVVWMTDGVTEAADASGAFFGVDRLATAMGQLMEDCLRAEDLVAGLMRTVKEFAGETPLRDDLTLVVLHLTSEMERMDVVSSEEGV